jgi:hypothetical protein
MLWYPFARNSAELHLAMPFVTVNHFYCFKYGDKLQPYASSRSSRYARTSCHRTPIPSSKRSGRQV